MQTYRGQSAGSGSGKCMTPEENREVMVGSLQKTSLQVGTFDLAAAAKVRHRPQKSWMDRVPSATGISAVRTKLGAGRSGGDAEFAGDFWKDAAEGRAINALMDDIVVGMWRTGGYTQLDPDAIPDTPPAAPSVGASALCLARTQGLEISWQQANPRTPGTGT